MMSGVYCHLVRYMLGIELLEATYFLSVVRNPRRKRKRKKPTEWFLRRQREEKEMRKRVQERRPQKPREPRVCLYYLGGKCAKVR